MRSATTHRVLLGHSRPSVALAVSAAVVASMCVAVPNAGIAQAAAGAHPVALSARPVPLTANGAPQTIPGIAGWTSARGTLTVTNGLQIATGAGTSDTAATLADELRSELGHTVRQSGTSRAGDVVLTEDPKLRATLGDEGYRLTIDDRIRVTGATDDGVFHGAQTVAQILAQGTVLPTGSAVDKPEFSERGVGICACQITVSVDWLQRLMKDMSYLKLNQLWMETKIKSDAYPKANFWGYFTQAQARLLSDTAKKYHITIVPEVNSPGHMSPWLRNYPDLQLVDRAGNRDADRLDITKPAAFTLITTLIDEYFRQIDSPYWHMGGDEYMLGSAYSNYPQFQDYIDAHPEIFPAGSTPTDVVINFMNRVDDYVRSKGKTLRIWNDSILQGTKLSLNKDIVVEHWQSSPDDVSPQQLVDDGMKVENAAYSLYLIRGYGSDPFNAESLWDQNWTPRVFDGGGTVTDDPTSGGAVTGAKVTAWPDTAPARTQNEVEASLFAATRFIAQATWGSPRPVDSYADFAALSERIGRVPGYANVDETPVPAGSYALTADGRNVTTAAANDQLVVGGGASQLTLAQTSDDYDTITSPDGRCLTMTGGLLTLQAPLDQGLAPTLVPCNSADNLQKWQIRTVAGGYTIANAITLEPLVLDGTTLVQQAPDVVRPAVFRFVGTLSVTLTLPSNAALGTKATGQLSVSNWLGAPAEKVRAQLVLPLGWGANTSTFDLGTVRSGSVVTKNVQVVISRAARLGLQTLTVPVTYLTAKGRAGWAIGHAGITVSCSSGLTSPAALVRVDSAESDFENTPGSAAIDGNPNTFWGTQWSQANPGYPHEITVDLGAGASTCGIGYLPRQNSPNGAIGRYEVYVRDSSASPTGTPTAAGTFAAGSQLKQVSFGAPVKGRYLTLRALSETGPNVTNTTTVAELTTDRATGTSSRYAPILRLGSASARAGSRVTVTITGAKPFWRYGLRLSSSTRNLAVISTGSTGRASLSFVVPASTVAGSTSVELTDGRTRVASARLKVTPRHHR